MNQCIQNCFAHGHQRILGPIFPSAALAIDNGAHFHISTTKIHGAGHHSVQISFYPFIVLETNFLVVSLANGKSHDGDGCDGKLRHISLGIEAEVHQSRQRRFPLVGHIQHVQHHRQRKFGEFRMVLFLLFHIGGDQIRVQRLDSASLYDSLVILHAVAKGFVAVDFVVRHRQVRITGAHVRALHATGAAIVAGSLCIVQAGDLRRQDGLTITLRYAEKCSHRRLHLLALLGHSLLQILQIIHAHRRKILSFIQAKKDNPATILVRKAGQRIVQPLRTALVGALHFDVLRLRLLLHHFSG